MYIRNQVLADTDGNSVFIWGARQTGKTTLTRQLFNDSFLMDLLDSDLYRRLSVRPGLLRELSMASNSKVIIVDEIQRIPELLNEIHWLIENSDKQYILLGSSPRKILKQGVNLLGGRALRYELFPLSYSEIPNFDLLRALNHGLLPRHYDSKNYQKLIAAYIGAYLEEEIIAESRIRNHQVFYGFLEKAAFANGEIVNFTNIATECAISSPTVKEYYNILVETMIGRFVQPYQKKPKRRVIQANKFYFFDVGIANYLLKRKNIEEGTEQFGAAFEHFIFLELLAYSSYSGKNFEIRFWRTASQIEVDFILDDNLVAIEVKGTKNVLPKHLKGLLAFNEEYTVQKNIIVSNEPFARKVGIIDILPWKNFLDQLWAGQVV